MRRSLSPWSAFLLVVVVVCVAGPVRPRAQQPPSVPQPTFRGGVDRVTVEATVVDKAGAPVRGLTAADFELRIDGQPRPVQTVLLIGADAGQPEPPPESAFPELTTNSLPAAAATPSASRPPARTVVIVADMARLTPGQDRPLVNAAMTFVRSLPARDRVGLLTLPHGMPRVDITIDRERVLKALPGVVGQRPPSPLDLFVGLNEAWMITRGDVSMRRTVFERECELRPNPVPDCAGQLTQEVARIVRETRIGNDQTIAMLRGLFEGLAKVDGPKAVVLLSQGMAPMDTHRGSFKDLGEIAGRSDIAIYMLAAYEFAMLADSELPAQFDFRTDQLLLAEGLQELAWASGATVIQQVGKLEAGFDRIAREMSARYVIGFDMEPSDRNGKPHKIEVTLRTGEGRITRHRREFTWTPPPSGSTAATPAADVRGALAAGAAHDALPIAVATYTSPELQPSGQRTPGQRTMLWLRVGTPQARPDSATVSFDVLNQKNERVASSHPLIQARPDEPLDFVAKMPLPPGRYVLRLGVKDEAGRMGTVEHPFEARVPALGPIAVGSLLVLDARAMAAGRSTLTRTLGPRDTAVHAFVEAQAPAGFDWSAVQASLDARSARDGAVRLAQPMTIRPLREPERRGFETIVPVSGWAPGAYELRVTFTHAGQTLTVPVRTIVLDQVPPPASDTPARSDTAAAAGSAGGASAATSERTDGTASSGAATPASGGASAPSSADGILRRAQTYAEAYFARGSSVVAEERYVQIVRGGPPNVDRQNVDEALEWRPNNVDKPMNAMDARRRRQLISDVLMVKSGDGAWASFRDVGIVDGRSIGDRTKRALRLFDGWDPAKDMTGALRKIADESSRYNLMAIGNFNVPMLPLFALQPAHVGRFAFERVGEATIDGEPTEILRYRETAGPAFIHNRKGDDVFLSGRFWVAADGRVLRTEMSLRDTLSGWLSLTLVSYRPAPSLGMLMPAEMWERHVSANDFRRPFLEGRARYTNFRRFDVAVTEAAETPK